MKYAILIIILISGCLLCVVYMLGRNHCRVQEAQAKSEQVALIQKTEESIKEKVLASSVDDNLNWLLNNYCRAD